MKNLTFLLFAIFMLNALFAMANGDSLGGRSKCLAGIFDQYLETLDGGDAFRVDPLKTLRDVLSAPLNIHSQHQMEFSNGQFRLRQSPEQSIQDGLSEVVLSDEFPPTKAVIRNIYRDIIHVTLTRPATGQELNLIRGTSLWANALSAEVGVRFVMKKMQVGRLAIVSIEPDIFLDLQL